MFSPLIQSGPGEDVRPRGSSHKRAKRETAFGIVRNTKSYDKPHTKNRKEKRNGTFRKENYP